MNESMQDIGVARAELAEAGLDVELGPAHSSRPTDHVADVWFPTAHRRGRLVLYMREREFDAITTALRWSTPRRQVWQRPAMSADDLEASKQIRLDDL